MDASIPTKENIQVDEHVVEQLVEQVVEEPSQCIVVDTIVLEKKPDVLPIPGFLHLHGYLSYDFTDAVHNGISYGIFCLHGHNHLIMGIRAVCHIVFDKQYNGDTAAVAQIPVFEYQIILFDFVNNKIEDFSGMKCKSYFHFQEGTERSVSVQLTVTGQIKDSPEYNEYAAEIYFMIRDRPDLMVPSVVNFLD